MRSGRMETDNGSRLSLECRTRYQNFSSSACIFQRSTTRERLTTRQALLAGRVGCLGDLTQPQAALPNKGKLTRKEKTVSFYTRLARFVPFPAED